MSTGSGAARTVQEIIEANCYLVLSTADSTGRPWGSPVYFAHIDFTEFYRLSSLEVTHSRNIAIRPEVGIVVFDSQAAVGAGQGVYMPATANLLEPGAGTDRAIAAFSRRSTAHGYRAWTSEDVEPGAELRLYRAIAASHSILAKDGRPDHRIPVPLG
ncbi:pyridoxamine 5'-phosphate oxidase family protein [Streptomyces brasiliensis]|uniref:Pyridoxamine 5'-phosphate oxidase N-terminal domain-containing protein n=1 Tax=Streptomyces brasiliensis TaxID=1954 RepID=A0A917L7C1_9ACTN|nr:pyridoxamine 5'-phosphate oxidase family protein [Streptomyces brasiliensis]GGJ45668.1 hypothetical protein GCM10010121_066140 [Streptomyces brasiliensis]